MISISMLASDTVAAKIGLRSDHGDQDQRQHCTEAGSFRRCGEAAVQRQHHAQQQNQERQHARDGVEALAHGVAIDLQDARALAARVG
jgi:hypothetical protein